MTGNVEKGSRCPLCGGRSKPGIATIPFVFPDTILLVKGVPTEICGSCHEPYVSGKVTDQLINLLNQLRALKAEVSIISYAEVQRDHTTTYT
jgi:YgiT-type zinc finger domain-containing protein